MHLASLCGVPIVVWMTLLPPGSDRYFQFGNPFQSQVFVVTEKTRAEIAEIFKVVNNALAQTKTIGIDRQTRPAEVCTRVAEY